MKDEKMFKVNDGYSFFLCKYLKKYIINNNKKEGFNQIHINFITHILFLILFSFKYIFIQYYIIQNLRKKKIGAVKNKKKKLGLDWL